MNRIVIHCRSSKCTKTSVKTTQNERLPWKLILTYQAPQWHPFIHAGIYNKELYFYNLVTGHFALDMLKS